MTDNPLPALADRVEQAREPSRELDAEIALAVGWTYHLRGDGHCWFPPNGKSPWEHEMYAPPFTSSIDAALTLVPENMYADINTYGDDCEVIGEDQKHKSSWTRFFKGRNEGREEEDIAKAAMSLCAAALRARAAAAGGGE